MTRFKFFRGLKTGESALMIPNTVFEGVQAHRNNLSLTQCPYYVGTMQRELWMSGWSAREGGYIQ
jgi:ribosome modulation factor